MVKKEKTGGLSVESTKNIFQEKKPFSGVFTKQIFQEGVPPNRIKKKKKIKYL